MVGPVNDEIGNDSEESGRGLLQTNLDFPGGICENLGARITGPRAENLTQAFNTKHKCQPTATFDSEMCTTYPMQKYSRYTEHLVS